MPYPDNGPKGSTALVIGMAAFIFTIVSLIVALVWLFVEDSKRALVEEHETVDIVEPVSNDTMVLSDAVDVLLSRSGVDAEVGDISADGSDPAVAVAEALNRRLSSDSVAIPIAYDYVQFLPAPSIVWIAEEDVARPVVLIFADEATVSVIDPADGEYQYGFTMFSKMYERAGRHALYISDRGYPTEGEYGDLQERGL